MQRQGRQESYMLVKSHHSSLGPHSHIQTPEGSKREGIFLWYNKAIVVPQELTCKAFAAQKQLKYMKLHAFAEVDKRLGL
jgi:hypothetical protein